MIAALLLRYGIPLWAAKLALAGFLLVVAAGGAVAVVHHIYHRGELASDARAEAREKENSRLADLELAKLNEKVNQAKAELALAVADLVRIETELSHEKRDSAALQAEYLAGAKRLSVLVRQRSADPTGPSPGAGTAVVGDGPTVIADLPGETSSHLEELRSTREQAIDRLEACVAQYQAVAKAVNAP
jgi:hypothetical protein